MPKRLQSPSSMNTYFQCPRKYYFKYVLKMPTMPSIHTVRGSVAHSALEHLYQVLPEVLSHNYKSDLRMIVTELLKKFWNESKKEFDVLDMSDQQLESYFVETQVMLTNYIDLFCKRLEEQINNGLSFPDAFRKLTPLTEKKYQSDEHQVMGYIDVIEQVDNKVRLMDYKTSKRAHISDEYKLQLAIYAMMYEIEHGKRPDEVGIYFLREGEQTLPVTDDLIKHGKFMVEQIHASTDGVDHIDDYPKKESPLCKWSTGQCDFYEHCFKNKKIPDKPLR